MDTLWAPWRSTYMESTKSTSCIFCEAARDPANDETWLVVFRGRHCYVILNRYPYTSGHLMVVPYAHVSRLEMCLPEATTEMMKLARQAEFVLQRIYQPGGLNLGMNLGSAAGAGIEEHLHMHILPRWAGDANFMTAVANARVIPEALSDTYAKVTAGFSKVNTNL